MRKLVTYVVVVATIMWSLGLAAVVPASATYSPVAGDLIKTATDSAVYYIDASGKRNLFVNGVTFWTWYSGSWSALKMGNDSVTIKILSQGDFDALTSGSHVAVRPGTKLIKFQNSPKVYVVSTGNVLREVSDTLAKSLFGADYATKKLITIQNGFESDYTKGAALVSGDKLPDGSLIKYTGSEDIYYIQDGLKRMVSTDAFLANGFAASSVVTVATSMSYTTGDPITGEEAAFTTVVGTVAGPVATAGSVMVALASDTPVSGLALGSAQRVAFTKVNFTASNDGDAIIDYIKVQRTGIGADTDFASLILVDQNGNVVGNSQTLNSAHQVTFSTDLTIPKGTTKSYTLAANMAASGSLGGGNVPTLSLVSVVAKGSTTVSGSLPIVGNVMTINSALTIGGVTVTATGASYNPSAATKQVGTEDYIFASLKATANSTEDIQIESIRWYQASTTADSDITGLELLEDGVTVVGTGSLVDKEVIFTFATPVKILKGNSKEYSIRGDIVNGSGRVASFGPSKITDWKVKGLTYNSYLNPTYDNATEPYLIPGPLATIGSGSITFSKATISSTNVAPSVANQELSAFYAQVIGEPVILTRTVFDVATGSGKIINVKLVDENGNVVAGPTDPGNETGVGPSGYATSTDSITFPVGTHKYTIKGDLVSSAQWATNASLAIRLDGAHLTAKGETTNLSITPSPSTFLSLDTLTVKTATLAVKTSASPAAQTVVKGTTGYTFSNFTLDTSGSGEDVKVTQLTLKHTTTVDGIFGDIQNITLFDGITALNTPVQGTSETADSAFASTATTTITLLTPLTIPKNTVKTLTLKADISGSATAAGHKFGIVRAGNVVAKGSGTGTSITPTVTASEGQLQTVSASGTLRYFAAGSNPGNQILVGNTLGNVVGVINVEALYENIEITDIGMTFNDAAGSNDVSSIDITDGTTTWTVPISGQYATASPAAGSLIIPQGSSKTLTVKANTSRSGLNQAAVSGDSFTITFSNIAAKGKSSGITGGAGGSTQLTITGQTTATNSNYIYASKPSVSNITSSIGSGLGRTLMQFTVSADAKGDVGFYKVTFDLSSSGATITPSNLKFVENPGASQIDLTYAQTGYTFPSSTEQIVPDVEQKGSTIRYNILFNTEAYTSSANAEYRIIGAGTSKTYALIGDLAKAGTNNITFGVSLVGDNAAAAVADAHGVNSENTSNNFIWSDLNYGNNTGTATGTNEWTNGYLILTTTSQSATF